MTALTVSLVSTGLFAIWFLRRGVYIILKGYVYQPDQRHHNYPEVPMEPSGCLAQEAKEPGYDATNYSKSEVAAFSVSLASSFHVFLLPTPLPHSYQTADIKEEAAVEATELLYFRHL